MCYDYNYNDYITIVCCCCCCTYVSRFIHTSYSYYSFMQVMMRCTAASCRKGNLSICWRCNVAATKDAMILHTQLSATRTHTPHKPLLGVVGAVQSVNATRRDSTYTILLVHQPLWCHCWHAGAQLLLHRNELLPSFNCTPTGSQISQARNGSRAGDSPIVWRYELYAHAGVHLSSALISTLEHLSLLQ